MIRWIVQDLRVSAPALDWLLCFMATLVEQVLSRKSNLLVLKVFLQQIYLLGFRFLDNKTKHKIFINYSSQFSGVRKRYLLRLNASALLVLPRGVLRKN